MLLYLDASALVKRYLSEPGTPETNQAVAEAEAIATTIVSRPEVAAALAKAVRVGAADRAETRSLLKAFRSDWSDMFRLNVNSTLAARAERLAWKENLRGYDAVQLAFALVWKEHIAGGVTCAPFDVALWEAAGRHALGLFPEDLLDVFGRLTQR